MPKGVQGFQKGHKIKRKTSFKGSANPNWKGGKIEFGDGRTLIYCPYHPFPNYCKTHVFEYRLIMEKELKRFLMPNEIVHHLDGDIKNNSLDNLVVMTQSEHARGHYHARKKDRFGRFKKT